MKRKITSLLAALLLMSGLTWAQTTDVLNHTVIGVPSTNYETWSDLTLTSGAVYAGNTAGGNEAIQMRSNNNNSGIVTTTSAGMVTNITVTWNSNTNSSRILNVYGSNTAYNAATDLYGDNAGTLIGTIPNGTAELEITEGYAFIGIRSANGALWLDEIQITWEEGGTPAPSISIENNNELAYNATSGSFNFTVNNPVSGGNMTVATEEEWISNPTIVGSAVNFTTTVNQAGAPREGVITLTYVYGEQTITKPVTITQAGNPDAVDNISDISAAGTYSVQGTIVAKNTRGFIVGDGTGYVYYYNASYSQADYNIGDMVKLAGSVVTYGGVFEFNNSTTITAATSSNYVAEDPTVLTGEQMDARVASSTPAELSNYVQYEGTLTISGSYYNITNIEGATTAKGSISYPIDTEFASLNGKQVKVTGYYVGISSGQYYNTMIGSVEEIVTTEPSIMVVNPTVNVTTEGAEGSLTVTYINIDEIVANVYFCDAEGVAASYDWITAEINDDDNVEYNVSANDGAARTAYLKVRVGNVYSNLVTINQAQYVADYATLPFEFDGGKADIDNTAGLTGYNLGSDYSSSPKLKFSNANETISSLILKFNEAPGTLTFDIKGNPSNGVWEGTFKVQTSVDGETYTDLGIYTNLTTTVQSESFDLSEDVRYIKWIYEEKSSGNVALGNIHLYELGGGPVTEYDLTIEPFENLEIFTFVGGDENNPFEGAGTIQVTVGDQVMLSIAAIEGYVIQSLMVDGVEHVNDITDDETYTFFMPDHNVTISATAVEDVPPTPFEPVTYTLATSIESGKSYIIVGAKTIDEEIQYYAMGGQNSNNRAGVAISVDGTTATVETADVHEVVITALEEEGFYSIYDGGYLYAAGSNKNWLRTQDSLDVNAQWSISIDTVSHIVADSSANRNVMQFNYNNGTPIFSCYGSDSQLPVYLYVKDEATTTVTQTIALEGTTWVSFYVDITLSDLQAALIEAVGTVPSGTKLAISNADGNTYYTRGRWMGSLVWDINKSYKITVPSACEITMEGMPVEPGTITIAGHGDATWIGFPFSESMMPTAAFAGVAQNGDVLKSQAGNTSYTRGRWNAEFPLQPGTGYRYVSAPNAADRTFVYPTPSKAK